MCGEIVCEPPADRALLVKVGLHKVAEVRRGEGEPPVSQQLHKLLQLVQLGGGWPILALLWSPTALSRMVDLGIPNSLSASLMLMPLFTAATASASLLGE